MLGRYILALALQLVPSQSLLERAYPELEDSSCGYTVVRFLGGRSHEGRRKRAVGECFHDVLSFTVTVDGSDLTLHLRENTELDMTKPVVVADDTGATSRQIPRLLETQCFQDPTHDAALGVTCRPLVSGGFQYILEGTFSADNTTWVIFPSRKRRRDEANHVVRQVNSTLDILGDVAVSAPFDDGIPVPVPPASNRTKRQAVLHEIELFIVADIYVYNFWLSRVDGSSDEVKAMNALHAIHQFFAFVVNGIDLRYSNIVIPRLAFRVLYAGLFIATAASQCPYTAGIARRNPAAPERPPFVDVRASLNAFRLWVNSNSNLLRPGAHSSDMRRPGDHTMLFTKADLTDNGRNIPFGAAYISTACTGYGVSVVEDTFNFIVIAIAAHELGHSRGTNCLLERDPGLNSSLAEDLLVVQPGQFYSIDDQCRFALENTSYFCRQNYDEARYPTLCLNTLCYDSGGCSAIVPARGTTCGNKQWCVDSQCMDDIEAPGGVTASCPFGDDPGDACRDLRPRDCYRPSTANRCCSTCANFRRPDPACRFGDRESFCSQICPADCYTDERVCCRTCPHFKVAANEGCEYGDRVVGCAHDGCLGYNSTELEACCQTCGSFEKPRPALWISEVALAPAVDSRLDVHVGVARRTPAEPAGNIICRFRRITVDEKGTLLTRTTDTEDGEFVRCDRVRCRLPGGEVPGLPGRRAVGWLVSLTSDDIQYGNERLFLPVDDRCVSCVVSRSAVCSWQDDYCFIDGVCYANGSRNPSNSCERCDVSHSTTEWADRAKVCTIGGECFDEGERNPDNRCERCDVTSPSKWSGPMLDGVESTCEAVCARLLGIWTFQLEDVVCKVSGLPDTIIKAICQVKSSTTVATVECPGTETVESRFVALCGHVVYSEARLDPRVCPP